LYGNRVVGLFSRYFALGIFGNLLGGQETVHACIISCVEWKFGKGWIWLCTACTVVIAASGCRRCR
jgi:hypothetical protein